MEEKIVRASENLPCDLCCIMALECALQIKISVFKLRTLLGERTPTITVGEVFFVRASKNLPCDFRCIMALECALRIKTSVFKLHTLLGKKTPKKITAPWKNIPEINRRTYKHEVECALQRSG